MSFKNVEPQISPCPCCGNEVINWEVSNPVTPGGPELFALECGNSHCGLIMPGKLSLGDAIRAWNNRVCRH